MTDYQTPSGRRKKQEPSADFRLADNDDFFGYSNQEGDFTLTQTLLMIFIGLPALYFALSFLLAMTPNI